MTRRASALCCLLQTLTTQPNDFLAGPGLPRVEERIFDVILDMIPSAEVIEPLHSRARIARTVLKLLHERLDDPLSVTELCVAVVRERTLHLSCVEAFGRPPATLLAELRLNAAHRALIHPGKETTVNRRRRAVRLHPFRAFCGCLQEQIWRASIRDVTNARDRREFSE